ncbi:MAG: Kelch repeat-containing protein [Chthoniobacterales bacterium]
MLRHLLLGLTPRPFTKAVQRRSKWPLLAILGLLPTLCQAGGLGHFESTEKMISARDRHTATLLSDGRVLAVGGVDNFSAQTAEGAETYDPTTDAWSATGSLITGRFSHSATLLAGGMVLVAGGETTGFVTTDSTELFDAATGTWTTTGSLNRARLSPTATLLSDGRVLVAAGSYDVLGYGGFSLASAEIYDPASGAWTTTGSLKTSRDRHSATLLPNGKVMVAGGLNYSTGLSEGPLASVEIYGPATGQWVVATSLATPRSSHTATLLPDGKVLVAGGYNTSGYLASAELYDPATGVWTETGSLQTARGDHTANLLESGQVLVTGGNGANGVLASAEIYNPSSGTWSATDSLAIARFAHTATLLADGRVLIAGGRKNNDSNDALASAELYVRSGELKNISTRLDIQTGDNVMIGGFIISGSEPETVIVRGIGPSLPLSGALSDPEIELYDSSGALVATNDKWLDDLNHAKVVAAGLGLSNELESAVWRTLEPGAYTVIMQGHPQETGIGLLEVYQISEGADGSMVNISTRGLVQSGDNVLIGGLIIAGGTGDGSAHVLVRALGPSLPVTGQLSNPTLELYDGDGTLLDSNDDWKVRSDGSSQQAEIEATKIVPTDDSEAALVETLPPGSYTAVVRGKSNGAGVALVEIYNLAK